MFNDTKHNTRLGRLPSRLRTLVYLGVLAFAISPAMMGCDDGAEDAVDDAGDSVEEAVDETEDAIEDVVDGD